MYIQTLTLKDFRNYVIQRVTASPSLNVLTGRNAAGKTNFLEALYMLGIGKSPRTLKEREVVRFGKEMAYAKAEIVKKYSRHTVEMYVDKTDKKRIAIDGLPIKKLGELMGVLGVVYFSPDELGLIKDAPSARRRFLDIALSQIEKNFGKGSVMKLGEVGNVNVDAIPTGALSLDIALGIGGVPRGRVIEVYGPESSGKTTVALHMIAEAQKMGGIAAFIDAEHALDPVYAKHLGVDVDNLIVSQPDTGEQALEIT